MRRTGLRVRARDLTFRLGAPRTRRVVRSLMDGAALDGRRDPFEELYRLWRNPSAADPHLLRYVWEQVHSGTGAILECGSGLTTLVLSIAARRTGRRLVTLEHSAYWAQANTLRLRVADAPLQPVRVRELRYYGDYQWYGLADDDIEPFSLVVCDGPPVATAGGRYGLLPRMHQHVAGATLILDDCDRPSERSIADRWSAEYGLSLETVDDEVHRSFAVGTIPDLYSGREAD